MTVAIACPSCGQPYQVPEAKLGRQTMCAKCGLSFTLSTSVDETLPPTDTAPRDKPPASTSRPSGAMKNSAVERAPLPVALPLMPPQKHGPEPLPAIKPYITRAFLGSGAMGKVYRAHDPRLKRDVAIKILPREVASDAARAKRFRREAQMAARVQHVNTVVIHEVDERDGHTFLVMEFVDGHSLDKAIAGGQRMDWRDATRAIRDAAGGLAAAHELGVVHRDIKPANLMRTGKGLTKVVDFGLARAAQSNTQLTQQGSLLGTPCYMAPEVWSGGEADSRSDLYSLICTYYHLLTGRVPFDAPDKFSLGYQHRYEPFPDPRAVVPELPDAICRILARGSRKEPAERFQTADDLLAALDGLLASPSESLTFGTAWESLGGTTDPAQRQINTPEDFFAAVLGSSTGPSGAGAPMAGSSGHGRPLPDSASATLRPATRLTTLFRVARRHWMPTTIVGLALLGGMSILFATLFKIRTADGTIALSVNQPDAEVLVDGQTITVHWGDDGKSAEITAPPGKHRIEVKKAGFVVSGKEVTIEEGGHEVLSVSLETSAQIGSPPKAEGDSRSPSPAVAIQDGNDSRFVPLFNGKDLSGWTIDRDDKNGWSVEDGVIFARGVNWRTLNYLLTDREYSDYVLRFEFSFERGASSGVAVRALPGEKVPFAPPGVKLTFKSTKLIDHPLVKLIESPEPNEQTGTMFSVLDGIWTAPDSPAVVQPTGSWNRMEIKVQANTICVSVNGSKVVDASLPRDARFPDGTVPALCRTSGQIGLQKHTGTVRFRNVEVMELPLSPTPQESGTRSSSYPAPPPVGEVGAPMKAGEVRDDNGLKMKFAYIPPGEFMMGSPESEAVRNGNEKQHRVRITKPFYMAVFSVTQSEYERVMGKNPSWFSSTGNGKNDVAGMDTSRFPVEYVSWDEAMEFCRKFTESEQKAGRLPAGWKYTLPTEAQWEYACRAGTTTAYNVGETISMKDARIGATKFGRTTVVGSYKPNAWGLYDMHGNVWQWCADWYDDKYYDNSPADDPLGPTRGATRVFRGGSWNDGPVLCRSTHRNGDEPAIRICHLGVRVARVPSSE
jgi:formylglycine-generating enzyme required for sulfatase activity/serine/threonine protein kinase